MKYIGEAREKEKMRETKGEGERKGGNGGKEKELRDEKEPSILYFAIPMSDALLLFSR